MDTQKHLETAIFLLKIAPDPLVLDAVRVFSTPKVPPVITRAAAQYVEKCYDSALILFKNCGKYSDHDLRYDRFTDPCGDRG